MTLMLQKEDLISTVAKKKKKKKDNCKQKKIYLYVVICVISEIKIQN